MVPLLVRWVCRGHLKYKCNLVTAAVLKAIFVGCGLDWLRKNLNVVWFYFFVAEQCDVVHILEGCRMVHMVVQWCTWLYNFTHGCTMLHMTVQLYTWLYNVAHGCKTLHMVVQCCTWLYNFTHGCTMLHMVL